MSARDELATTIHRRICEESLAECLESEGYCVKAADSILAAGYRKPRTITTLEELEELPVGAVTLSANGAVSEKVYDGPVRGWRMTGDGAHHEPPALPATVLHEPETKA